jgi:hypothetical protein
METKNKVLFIRLTPMQMETINVVAELMQRSLSDTARILLFRAVNDFVQKPNFGIDLPLEQGQEAGNEHTQ